MGSVSVQTFSAPFLWLGSFRALAAALRMFTDLSLTHSCIVVVVCQGSLLCWKVNFSSVWGPECTRSGLLWCISIWGLQLATKPWSSDGADRLEQSPLPPELSDWPSGSCESTRQLCPQGFGVDHDEHRPISLSELDSWVVYYSCTWSPGGVWRLDSFWFLHDNLEVSSAVHFCHRSGIWEPFLNLWVQAILQGFYSNVCPDA